MAARKAGKKVAARKPAAGTAARDVQKETWEGRRSRVRQELIDEGLRQFHSRGFDEVTVSDIVAKVDISRRSFFRYFDSKDDLAFSWMEDSGAVMIPVLEQQLRSQDLIRALREAFLEAARIHDRSPDRPTKLTQLVFGTPSLRGRYQCEYVRWEKEFARIAQKVLKVPDSKMYELHVQSALAITAWASALQEWARLNHRKPLRGFVESAFGILMKEAGRKK